MSFTSRSIAPRSQPAFRMAGSLHGRFLVAVGLGGVVAIALLAWGATSALNGVVARQGDVRVADAARRGLLVVDDALAERVRQAEFIAASPEVISAARAGGARAQALGIVNAPIQDLEKHHPVAEKWCQAAIQDLDDVSFGYAASQFMDESCRARRLKSFLGSGATCRPPPRSASGQRKARSRKDKDPMVSSQPSRRSRRLGSASPSVDPRSNTWCGRYWRGPG